MPAAQEADTRRLRRLRLYSASAAGGAAGADSGGGGVPVGMNLRAGRGARRKRLFSATPCSDVAAPRRRARLSAAALMQ